MRLYLYTINQISFIRTLGALQNEFGLMNHFNYETVEGVTRKSVRILGYSRVDI